MNNNDANTQPSNPPPPQPQPKEVALTTEKLLVLAVGKNPEGKMFIVPIDLEHEQDDQTTLSPEEAAQYQASKQYLFAHLPELEHALEHLYGIFSRRWYRSAFRSFENFCFALLGMARLPKDKETKARVKVKALQKGNVEDKAGPV